MAERPQTRDLGIIGLNPAARRVDQFAAPEVRGEREGDSLLQLAQALSDINPALQGIVDRRHQAFVQGSQARAVTDAAKHRFDNQKALKDAVTRGELPESSNPWYMVQMRQEVARHEGRRAKDSAWAAYQNSDIQFSDDPAAVEAFLDEQLGPTLAGRDVWEAEALIPELQEARESISRFHVNKRSQEREVEREVAFQTDVQSVLNSLDPEALASAEAGDPAAAMQVNAIVAEMQAKLNEAGKTVHWPKANKWIVEAVANEALARGDTRLAREVLSKITTNSGASLADTAEVKNALDRLEQQITNRERQEREAEIRDQQIKANEQSLKLLDASKTKLVELRKTNPAATIADVMFTLEELGDISPEALLSYQQKIVAYASNDRTIQGIANADDIKDIQQKYLNEKLGGTLTKAGEISYINALAEANGLDSAEEVQGIAYRFSNESGTTDIEIKSALWDEFSKGTLTAQRLILGVRNGTIAAYDADQWLQRINAQRNGIFGRDGDIKMTMDRLDRLVTTGYLGQFDDTFDPSELQTDQQQQLASSLAEAKNDLLTLTDEWVRNNPQASAEDRLKKMEELLDTVSSRYGGLTLEQFRSTTTRRPDPKPGQPTTAPVAIPSRPTVQVDIGESPDPEIGDITRVDPVVGKVTDDDLRIMKTIMETRSTVGTSVQAPRPYTPGGLIVAGSEYDEVYRDTNDPLSMYIKHRQRIRSKVPNKSEAEDIQMRSKTLAYTAELGKYIETSGTVEKFQSLIETIRSRRQAGDLTVTTDEKRRAIILSNKLREYALLRQHLGWTVEEAKHMGKGAWRRARLFTNEFDFAENGKNVARELGVLPEEATEFTNIQRKLING